MKYSNVDTKTKNWYYDKYITANIHKNILLIITILLSIGIFISLILVKYVYENKSVEPYIIKIDPKSGRATIVETESKKVYTAAEVLREAFVVRYIKSREGYNPATTKEDQNQIRLMTTKDAYSVYQGSSINKNADSIPKNRTGSNIEVFVRSLVFTGPKSAEVKITKRYTQDGGVWQKKFFRVRIFYDFYDLDLSLEDRYLNPLGFQVAIYEAIEEKVAPDEDLDAEKVASPADQARLNQIDNQYNLNP